jgi:glyoxylase-like metal-dependent hydrolase (beta-lactamase superfamily II)
MRHSNAAVIVVSLFFALISPRLTVAAGKEKSLARSHQKSQVRMTAIAGDEEFGSYANSILIEGKDSVVLVDTQRTVLNAKKVVAAIQALGKPLTAVFITHAHPDHFLGAAVIRDAFPQAQFLATAGVVSALRQDADKMRVAISSLLKSQKASDEIPASVVIPQVLTGNSIPFKDTKIEVLNIKQAETEEAGLLVLPELRTVIAGDVVYNKTHLWLHDGRFNPWKDSLKDLKKIKGIVTIYPGHGPVATMDVVDENIKYIEDFEAALKSTAAKADATEKIEKLYPHYKMKRFLTYAVETLF